MTDSATTSHRQKTADVPRMHLRTLTLGVPAMVLLLLAGCATSPPNASGVSTMNINPGVAGPVQGVGIESQDVVSMADQMMRDMLTNVRLMQPVQGKAPRVVIDAQLFSNDSSQPLNRNIITDRIRVALNRASAGRLQFVGRQFTVAVESERALKRSGITDVGTTGMTKATLGVDYQLGGRITSMNAKSQRTGLIQRFTQISFEMVDMESGEIVWSGMYDFARTAGDDVVYR